MEYVGFNMLICSYCGKNEKEVSIRKNFQLCERHYRQKLKYGYNFRTIYDPNEIIIEGDISYICLYDKKGNTIAKTIVDTEDLTILVGKKLHYSRGYAIFSIKRNIKCPIHRLITNCENGNIVDHIDGNPLNNTKSNLRICNHAENIRNQVSDKIKGVRLKASGKWQARLQYNKKEICLGYFSTKEEAEIARVDGEKKYFKEFAPKH